MKESFLINVSPTYHNKTSNNHKINGNHYNHNNNVFVLLHKQRHLGSMFVGTHRRSRRLIEKRL